MYSSADGLEDVKQDHMVTIFVRNGTGDSWRIQMKLETNGSRGTYSSSPAVIFLGAKDMKRFSCTTIAMAQEVDTSIEVVANTVVQPDKAMESLIKRVQSAPIIAKPDRNGDEIARIYLGLKESFKPGEPHETLDGGLIVKSVVLRTSKTFAIVNSSYEVTVNADRKWATHKTNVEPTSTECSVQLSNPRWADLLQEMSNGQHTWDAELAVFFADVDPGAANGYPFFMDKVRYVRDLLERAIAASANAKERRP